MKQLLREYFTFNRRERRGIFFLLSIILLLILYLSFSDYFFNYFFPEDKIDFSKFQNEIVAFETEQKRINDSAERAVRNYFSGSNIPESENIKWFNFNPNNLSEKDWKQLGLSDKQIRTIKNYENKGGKFYKKEDLKKIFGITEKLYSSLEPYIQIPEEEKEYMEKKSKTKTPLSSSVPARVDKWGGIGDETVELNSADTTELIKLKGIGSTFAKRIIGYRKLLGGFVNKEQLMEVYGFDKEKFDLISAQVTIDISVVKKININLASADELKKHPYIKWKLVQEIVAFRNKNGNFSDLQEIKKLNFADEQLFSKLAPYLTINDK